MPGRKTTTPIFHLCGAASAAVIALGGACAFAQPVTVEELTVQGHHHHHAAPDDVAYRVGYSDLNLRTAAGMKELEKRIKISAAYVCKKMHETDGACEAEAIHEAKIQARTAQHQMRAHGKHSTPGSPWVPPPS